MKYHKTFILILPLLPILPDLAKLQTAAVTVSCVLVGFIFFAAAWRLLQRLLPDRGKTVAWIAGLAVLGFSGHAFFNLLPRVMLSLMLLLLVSPAAMKFEWPAIFEFSEPLQKSLFRGLEFFVFALILAVSQWILARVLYWDIFEQPAGSLLVMGVLVMLGADHWIHSFKILAEKKIMSEWLFLIAGLSLINVISQNQGTGLPRLSRTAWRSFFQDHVRCLKIACLSLFLYFLFSFGLAQVQSIEWITLAMPLWTYGLCRRERLSPVSFIVIYALCAAVSFYTSAAGFFLSFEILFCLYALMLILEMAALGIFEHLSMIKISAKINPVGIFLVLFAVTLLAVQGLHHVVTPLQIFEWDPAIHQAISF